jgi:hypothetical protein
MKRLQTSQFYANGYVQHVLPIIIGPLKFSGGGQGFTPLPLLAHLEVE